LPPEKKPANIIPIDSNSNSIIIINREYSL
jgi:hypothetical protein